MKHTFEQAEKASIAELELAAGQPISESLIDRISCRITNKTGWEVVAQRSPEAEKLGIVEFRVTDNIHTFVVALNPAGPIIAVNNPYKPCPPDHGDYERGFPDGFASGWEPGRRAG